MKIKPFLLIIGLSIITYTANAQEQQKYMPQKNSVGFGVGALSYSGRFVVGTKFTDHSSIYASAMFRHKVYKNSFLRIELFGGRLRADNRDAETQFDKPRGTFQATLVELTAKAEYEFIDLYSHKFSPYIIVGAGGYTLLDYYSTQGDKEAKDKTGFIVPLGGGVRYKLNNRVKLFAEGNLRFFSKNLDNRIGENINNPNKYYSVGIGAIYELTPINRLW